MFYIIGMLLGHRKASPTSVLLLVVLLSAFLSPGFAHAWQTLYGINWGDLYVIDPETAVKTLVGNTGLGDVHGLGFDPLTGRLIAGTRSNNGLVWMDPSTAHATYIGDPGIGDFHGMSVDSTGAIYAVAGPGNLYRLDRNTAAATLVLQNVGGPNLSFDLRTDTLYCIDHRGPLYTLDVASGQKNIIWPGVDFPWNGLAFDASNGRLLGCESTLHELDLAGGGMRLIGDLGVNMRGLEFGAAYCTPPTITNQPASVIVCVGQPVSLNLTAVGNPSPSIQWRRNGVGIGGATGEELLIDPATVDDNGTYDAEIANACGTIISDAAVVVIWPTGTGDANGDGAADGLDVPLLIETLLGSTAGPAGLAFCAVDMDQNGTIDQADIAMLIARLLD